MDCLGSLDPAELPWREGEGGLLDHHALLVTALQSSTDGGREVIRELLMNESYESWNY